MSPSNSYPLSSIEGIKKYRLSNPNKHLIVDTCALLIFLIGKYSKEYLKECPLMIEGRRPYTEKDFELIEEIIKIFPNKIVPTPHIISEVSMLSHTRIESNKRNEYYKKLIEQLENYANNEKFIELKEILTNKNLIQFGFTDISLVEIAKKEKWLILTDDGRLYRKFGEAIPIIYLTGVATSNIIK
jgi:hypothetical protein